VKPAVSVLLVPGAGTVPSDATAVVIDVLRATTTLSVALANGAGPVLPADSPEQARKLAERHPGALLCGERDGRRIAGFDLGNSPAEYGRDVVAGRTLVFASTNGSLALLAAHPARTRWLGCFATAGAVLEEVAKQDRVVCVCAGKLGRPSLEDTAFAGWLCARLAGRGAQLDPAARMAARLAPRDDFDVRALVEGSSHGRYLRALGGEFARDVAFAAGVDRLDRAFAV
jgi:2-phosphosulfolactate phosphatase